MNFEQLEINVLLWAKQKGILAPENHLKQMGKVVSEVGELCDSIIKENKDEQIDAIGDVLVTIIILANQLDINAVKALETAYNVIKDRTGKNINGTFIRDK